MPEEEYEDGVESGAIESLGEQIGNEDVLARASSEVMNSSGGVKKDSNFLHLQISNTEMLDKLEHFYRGDKWGPDKRGDYVWLAPENKELVTFNDFGVSTMMDIVTKYIDKNTTLSYYDETRIYEIMGDLGDELILLILSNRARIDHQPINAYVIGAVCQAISDIEVKGASITTTAGGDSSPICSETAAPNERP